MLNLSAPSQAGILAMRGVTKTYGATIAVRNVSFDIDPGEIHALIGENGAGKSTIVKILSGIVMPDQGSIELIGAQFAPRNPMDAHAAGVSTAFQELSLLPNLTVAQNLMLPRQVKGPLGLVSAARGRERCAEILAQYGLGHIHPDVTARALSLAERQRVEIVRAVSRNPRLLVLDEPTAALADPAWLFEILGRITKTGAGILYISHRLSEVRQLCRRGTVLRNGESIATVALEELGDDRIFELMVGTEARPNRNAAAGPVAQSNPVALSLKHVAGGTAREISLDIHRGEIVGVAALEGQGQRDLFRMMGGLVPIAGGEIQIDGNRVDIDSPIAAVRAGIGFVPEERKTEGVFLGLRTDRNITMSHLRALTRLGVIDRARERMLAAEQARRVELRPRYLRLEVGALSGGNQQKALIARVLASGARHLVLFDPTRGVDVGTKAVIYDLIKRFASEGGDALIYSTDLSELVHLVDRCIALYGGTIVGEVCGDELSEQRLVALASGHAEGRRAGP
jgi:ribose transport system ATP-binding protein